jgi:hypothetical protein
MTDTNYAYNILSMNKCVSTGVRYGPLLQIAIMHEQFKIWPPTKEYSFTEKLHSTNGRLLEIVADII